VFDKYCYLVQPIIASHAGSSFDVNWTYDSVLSRLNVILCAGENSPKETSFSAILMDYTGLEVLDSWEDIHVASCTPISLSAQPGSYVLIVNNMVTNEQHRYSIIAEQSEKSTTSTSPLQPKAPETKGQQETDHSNGQSASSPGIEIPIIIILALVFLAFFLSRRGGKR